jgi:hypothetical protein
MGGKSWSEEDINFLTENYSNLGAYQCAEILGRTESGVAQKACRLNIKGKDTKDSIDSYIRKLRNKRICYEVLEDYKGSTFPIEHKCNDGHTWKARPANILAGTRCPICSSNWSGFNPDLPSILYYIKIIKDDIIRFKIGITNNTVDYRFKKDKSNVTIITLLERPFETGFEAKLREQFILNKFKEYKSTDKLLKSDGNTELFTKDVLELDF